MHAFRTYILPKFKQAAARSLCDSWASCFSSHWCQSDSQLSKYCVVWDPPFPPIDNIWAMTIVWR